MQCNGLQYIKDKQEEYCLISNNENFKCTLRPSLDEVCAIINLQIGLNVYCHNFL